MTSTAMIRFMGPAINCGQVSGVPPKLDHCGDASRGVRLLTNNGQPWIHVLPSNFYVVLARKEPSKFSRAENSLHWSPTIESFIP